MSRNCKDIYIPRIEPKEGKCPGGYTGSDCVIVKSCISGFEGGTLSEFVNFLNKLTIDQKKQINILNKQIRVLENEIKELKLSI